MKAHIFSVFFAMVIFPLMGQTAEAPFFSGDGRYVLSSDITLMIHQDELGHQDLTLTLTFASEGINKTLFIDHPGENYLAYWDATNQTLWCGTTHTLGYLNVRTPQSAVSEKRPRIASPQDSDHFPPVPTAFSTKLESTIPARRARP